MKYFHRLNDPIQERVAIRDVFSIDEAKNKAIKIEVMKQSFTFLVSFINRRARRR